MFELVLKPFFGRFLFEDKKN